MKQPKVLSVGYYETAGGRYPVQEFLLEIDKGASDKLAQLLRILEEHGPSVVQNYRKFFDSLGDDLHELRLQYKGKWYRIIFFYAGQKAIICHAFEKETNKTPKREIKTALDRKRTYEKLAETPKAK
jgi:phage-related protein